MGSGIFFCFLFAVFITRFNSCEKNKTDIFFFFIENKYIVSRGLAVRLQHMAVLVLFLLGLNIKAQQTRTDFLPEVGWED